MRSIAVFQVKKFYAISFIEKFHLKCWAEAAVAKIHVIASWGLIQLESIITIIIGFAQNAIGIN